MTNNTGVCPITPTDLRRLVVFFNDYKIQEPSRNDPDHPTRINSLGSLPGPFERLVDAYIGRVMAYHLVKHPIEEDRVYDDWGNISIPFGLTVDEAARDLFQHLLDIKKHTDPPMQEFLEDHLTPELKQAFSRIQLDPDRKTFAVKESATTLSRGLER